MHADEHHTLFNPGFHRLEMPLSEEKPVFCIAGDLIIRGKVEIIVPHLRVIGGIWGVDGPGLEKPTLWVTGDLSAGTGIELSELVIKGECWTAGSIKIGGHARFCDRLLLSPREGLKAAKLEAPLLDKDAQLYRAFAEKHGFDCDGPILGHKELQLRDKERRQLSKKLRSSHSIPSGMRVIETDIGIFHTKSDYMLSRKQK